jgi:hypothetical protein
MPRLALARVEHRRAARGPAASCNQGDAGGAGSPAGGPVDRFVIDLIRADGELVGVQTGGLGPLAAMLDALLDRHRFRIVHAVAAERRIVGVDEHGEVLSTRRPPRRGTVVEVFDKLTAFRSLLKHPNLTVEVLLLGEDHIRAARPVTVRRRTRNPGARHLRQVIARIELHGADDVARPLPPLPPQPFSTPELARLLGAARGSRRGPPTARGRSTSSKRPASAAARRCTGGVPPQRDTSGVR